MLHDFLTRERNTILTVAKQKASESRWARLSSDSVEQGWSVFYDDLTGILKGGESAELLTEEEIIAHAAEKKGKEYLRLGYAISEVVQSYGIIYQAITESAVKLGFDITTDEFKQLNASLDTAIAEVVAEFEIVQTEVQDVKAEALDKKESERMGFLAHELRNNLQSASIALEMLQSGIVTINSKTGQVLQSSLGRMDKLIDTALAQVRMRLEPDVVLRKVSILEVLAEVAVTAEYQARSRKINLRMQGGSDVEIMVDRHLFASALSNLVQNALKFSRPGGTVQVRTRHRDDHILVEVEDECGGLPEGKIEELFETGVQKSADRTGLGLGLAISKQAVERNNGTLRVENLPGKGCIFIIDLPKASAVVPRITSI